MVQGTWGHDDPPPRRGYYIQVMPPHLTHTHTYCMKALTFVNGPTPVASDWPGCSVEVLVHYGETVGGPESETTSFSNRQQPVGEVGVAGGALFKGVVHKTVWDIPADQNK